MYAVVCDSQLLWCSHSTEPAHFRSCSAFSRFCRKHLTFGSFFRSIFTKLSWVSESLCIKKYKIMTFTNKISRLAGIHKRCFITFAITSELYMAISYLIYKYSRRYDGPQLADHERSSLRLKKYLCIVNVVSILLMGYFFVRHYKYCEGGSELMKMIIFHW